MGPGYNRMNVVTVQQTTQGFAKYLLDKIPEVAKSNGVVIGDRVGVMLVWGGWGGGGGRVCFCMGGRYCAVRLNPKP
jgi:hypothetical protein